MLVLTRRIDESLVMGINQEIQLKVLKVSGKQVKLGISAPKHIKIHREEMLENLANLIKEEVSVLRAE